jgi:hypothetical protein
MHMGHLACSMRLSRLQVMELHLRGGGTKWLVVTPGLARQLPSAQGNYLHSRKCPADSSLTPPPLTLPSHEPEAVSWS